MSSHDLKPLPAETRSSLLSGHDWIALVFVAMTFLIPVFSTNPQVLSQTNLILIAATAALGVYIMQRLDLMSFAVPSFMAIGGYTVALISMKLHVTDVLILAAAAFLMPALCAIPLGSLILRLKGVYFVLVTFVLTEIVQLLLFEAGPITGGANGLVGMPAVKLFGFELWDNPHVLLTTCGLAVLSFAITSLFTRTFRHEFAAIETNDVLAESLGLAAWKYKAMAFSIAAGVSGLAGFALVNMLMTAHPSSFAPMSSVNYITYTIVGGKASILGTLIGALLLVSATDYFALSGEMSPGLFGLLIIIVTLVARGGVVGVVSGLLYRLVGKTTPLNTGETGHAAQEHANQKEGRP